MAKLTGLVLPAESKTEKEKAPEFLKSEPKDEITKGALEKLATLTKKYLSYQEDIKENEEAGKKLKKVFNKLGQEEIPNLLAEYGLSEIKLSTGEKVIVKQGISATVPEDKEQEFYEFLKKRKEDDIIKLFLAFDRMEPFKLKMLFNFLNACEYDYGAQRKVHPQTLNKYFKELLGTDEEESVQAAGIKSGKFLRKEDLNHIANIFVYFKTTIK